MTVSGVMSALQRLQSLGDGLDGVTKQVRGLRSRSFDVATKPMFARKLAQFVKENVD